MTVYRLQRTQRLPVPLGEAWAFFSDPRNLSRITPPWLNLNFTCPLPEKMHAGMIVTYRVRPLLGIPMTWVAEITHVDEPRMFVDEQRLGPYRFWHHQHHFREVEGGVEMDDIVHYALPLGPLSPLADALLVRRRLEGIFRYREEALAERFGAPRGGGAPDDPR